MGCGASTDSAVQPAHITGLQSTDASAQSAAEPSLGIKPSSRTLPINYENSPALASVVGTAFPQLDPVRWGCGPRNIFCVPDFHPKSKKRCAGGSGISLLSPNNSSMLSIGLSFGIVIIAALNLVIDFDFIEEGSEKGAPKYMEWYGAFGLLVTLIWLYLELLRLLAKMKNR